MFSRGFFCKKFPLNDVITVEKTIDEKDEQLRKILFENYELTSEIIPETTAQSIAAQVNLISPGLIKDNHVLGKRLGKIYSGRLQSQHLSKGVAYNLLKIEN